ncbi:MAG: PPOX class F420-dependent oxidoreductase [Pseudonocardiaceae bacterium]
MASELERLAGEKYVQLTTFRKSGEGVPTPIWAVANGDELFVWTPRDSGKVKRIRRDGHVEITACDALGRITHGATVPGQARLLDDKATDRVRTLIGKKYGLFGWLSVYGSMLRGGRQRTVGVAIKLDG